MKVLRFLGELLVALVVVPLILACWTLQYVLRRNEDNRMSSVTEQRLEERAAEL